MGPSSTNMTGGDPSSTNMTGGDPSTNMTGGDRPANGQPTPAGMKTEYKLTTTSTWCNSALETVKEAYGIAKACASGAWETLKETTVKDTPQTKFTAADFGDKDTDSAADVPKNNSAAAVIARRRLQNRPKSHVVVLERLLEEIRESERNCKLRRR